jgi:uncharacterized protein YndB with AHSA1/START domain
LERSNAVTQTIQAGRVILANPRTLFRAFLDDETMSGWRAFDGVDLTFSDFRAHSGGGYQILVQSRGDDLGPGLPAKLEIAATFVELVGEERIVEAFRILSAAPDLAGTLTLTTRLEPDRDGTKVTCQAQGAPWFLRYQKQDEILATSLRRLALLTE